MSNRDKQIVSFRETRELQAAIELIQEVLDNLKKGTVTVQQNEQAITVNPTSSVRLTIKAKHKSEEESIEFKMKWDVGASSQVLDGEGAPIGEPEADDDEGATQE